MLQTLKRKHETPSSVVCCCLLKRDETRAVSGTNTGPTVLDGLVGQRELAQIEANHFRLNFDLCVKQKQERRHREY